MHVRCTFCGTNFTFKSRLRFHCCAAEVCGHKATHRILVELFAWFGILYSSVAVTKMDWRGINLVSQVENPIWQCLWLQFSIASHLSAAFILLTLLLLMMWEYRIDGQPCSGYIQMRGEMCVFLLLSLSQYFVDLNLISDLRLLRVDWTFIPERDASG